MRAKILAIILILMAVLFLGCTKKDVESQTPPLSNQPMTQPDQNTGTNETETPISDIVYEEQNDLENIVSEMQEIEQLLNELNDLENISFDVS